jgi:hypothetical protein
MYIVLALVALIGSAFLAASLYLTFGKMSDHMKVASNVETLRRHLQVQYPNVAADVDKPVGLGGRVVWVLWYQGWEHAPWLTRFVVQSWAMHNPGWTIQLVSKKNLGAFMDTTSLDDIECPAARSDLLRLRLLDQHGGVWADATLICMLPLDSWVQAAVQPTGIWMYHGHEDGLGPASWLIVSGGAPSYIMRAWRRAADEYWAGGRISAHAYFWMDGLFLELLEHDERFASEWRRVPYLNCEARGQSHMLAGKLLGCDPTLQKILWIHPPYVVKLSRHFNSSLSQLVGTNLYAAIDGALEPRWLASGNIPKHDMVVPTVDSST